MIVYEQPETIFVEAPDGRVFVVPSASCLPPIVAASLLHRFSDGSWLILFADALSWHRKTYSEYLELFEKANQRFAEGDIAYV